MYTARFIPGCRPIKDWSRISILSTRSTMPAKPTFAARPMPAGRCYGPSTTTEDSLAAIPNDPRLAHTLFCASAFLFSLLPHHAIARRPTRLSPASSTHRSQEQKLAPLGTCLDRPLESGGSDADASLLFAGRVQEMWSKLPRSRQTSGASFPDNPAAESSQRPITVA
jgi:hypothetical protein